MNVCIARDGAEIGEHPVGKLERLARQGELQPTDLYWHEGMETWLALGDFLGLETWERRKFSAPLLPMPVMPQTVRRSRRVPIPPPPPLQKAPVGSPWVFTLTIAAVIVIWAAAIAVKVTRPAGSERSRALVYFPSARP